MLTPRRRGSAKMVVVMICSLAVVLLVAGIFVVVRLVNRNSVTIPNPSGRFRCALIEVKADPYEFVAKPSGSGDATAPSFTAAQAAADKASQILVDRRNGQLPPDAKDLPTQIEEALSSSTPPTVAPVRCAAELVTAADAGAFSGDAQLAKGGFFWHTPVEFSNGLEYAGKGAIVEGKIVAAKGDTAGAERIFRAALIYGIRLTQSHVRVQYQVDGLNVQLAAATALTELWAKSDPEKAKKARAYGLAVLTALKAYNDVWGSLCRSTRLHPGDLILAANTHPDPAWRVDALLAIGMSRHSKTGKPWEPALLQTLNKHVNDSNPNIAAAAKWSLDLKVEDWRTEPSK